ncbi:hypothetical protein PINS_up010516 [Pythium insidiosum]|nr:hypothetical protein PINS_up010516 [Pythium insidiosum]
MYHALQEDAGGGATRVTLLNDLDFNAVLCQPTSPLWTASFLLQPYLSTTRRHPEWPFTLVGRFSAAASTSVHVTATESYFAELPLPLADSTSSSGASRRRAPTVPRAIDELVRLETAALVQHVEIVMKQKLKQLQAEFLVTRTHRLMLLRVSHVVYTSDLQPQREQIRDSRAAKTLTRPASLQLSQEESAFLEAFGAQAEARLDDHAFLPRGASAMEAAERLKRLLQRRAFMLRETMWNPASTTFVAKPMAWDDDGKRQPQQYEMVRVCRPCYLIHHAQDAERFQATKSTVKAAARRLTLLHNAKMAGEASTSSAPVPVPAPVVWASQREDDAAHDSEASA